MILFKENNMENEIVAEAKIVADDGISTIETPDNAEGGEVKDRKADLKKSVDPVADSLKEEKDDKACEDEEKEADADDKDEKKSDPLKEAKEEEDKDESDEDEKSEDESDDEEKEDIKESEEASAILKVFEGVELSEEIKRSVLVVFEAAVDYKAETLAEAKSATKVAALEEAYKVKYENHVKKVDEDIQTFLEATSKEWLEENKIAIEEASKVQMAETLIESIKDLFVEHNVAFDIDTSVVLESIEEELKEATKATEEALLVNESLLAELNAIKKEAAFAELSEGLTTSQVEKLRLLSSKIVMEDVDTFKTDINTLKESFFPSTLPVVKESEEAPIAKPATVQTLSEDPTVDSIIKAISARNK